MAATAGLVLPRPSWAPGASRTAVARSRDPHVVQQVSASTLATYELSDRLSVRAKHTLLLTEALRLALGDRDRRSAAAVLRVLYRVQRSFPGLCLRASEEVLAALCGPQSRALLRFVRRALGEAEGSSEPDEAAQRLLLRLLAMLRASGRVDEALHEVEERLMSQRFRGAASVHAAAAALYAEAGRPADELARLKTALRLAPDRMELLPRAAELGVEGAVARAAEAAPEHPTPRRLQGDVPGWLRADPLDADAVAACVALPQDAPGRGAALADAVEYYAPDDARAEPLWVALAEHADLDLSGDRAWWTYTLFAAPAPPVVRAAQVVVSSLWGFDDALAGFHARALREVATSEAAVELLNRQLGEGRVEAIERLGRVSSSSSSSSSSSMESAPKRGRYEHYRMPEPLPP